MNLRRRTALALTGGLLALVVLLSPLAADAASPPQSAPPEITTLAYQEHIPLGIMGFFMRPARRTLYVMGTARSAVFQGWRRRSRGGKTALENPDGSPVKQFPGDLSFRITASAMLPEMIAVDRDFLDNVSDVNAFLTRLGFRLKIFHGLDVTTLEPNSVDMIGMPADVPYDERVYRLSFTLPHPVPIEDRLVLEVLNPNGDRMCRFHLEF